MGYKKQVTRSTLLGDLDSLFRSSAWSLESLRQAWLQVISRTDPLLLVQNCVVLVGDGMMQAKKGRRMLRDKKLHQESENVSKGEYIFGHLFGVIGRDPSDFEDRILFLLENENREYIPEDWVPSSTYCLVSDDKRVIGAVNIRHSFRENDTKHRRSTGHMLYRGRRQCRKKILD
ncbi:hypothetical protein GK047_28625 [Paenibacillus sp. SYP-B3998]|uniref:Uncharacterized protein n=1 Tax=Paenibacillus sp. SYP-B3998 TaxID=2678564 RepID=A0A6G4A6C1_9BACL|nr:hypothetical protein [Paenibacillus sp. SYP-B3998]